jgi:hypothetical protein
LAQGENFGSAIGGGFGVTAIILLGIAAVVLTLQAIGRAIQIVRQKISTMVNCWRHTNKAS